MSTKTMNYLLVLAVLLLLFASIYQTYVNCLQYGAYYYGDGCPLHCVVCPLYPDKQY